MARLPTSTSPVSMVLFSRRNILPAERKTDKTESSGNVNKFVSAFHPCNSISSMDKIQLNTKDVLAVVLALLKC